MTLSTNSRGTSSTGSASSTSGASHTSRTPSHHSTSSTIRPRLFLPGPQGNATRRSAGAGQSWPAIPPNHPKPRPIAHPISITRRTGNGKGQVNVSRTAKSAGITSQATSCASPLWASRSVIGGVPLRTRPPRYWPTNPPTPLLTRGAPRLGIRQQRSVHGVPPLRKELPAHVIPLARRAPSALLGQQADPLLGASAAKAAPDVGHRPHQRMAVHSSEAARPHMALHVRDGVTSAFTSSERPGPLVVLLELVVLVAM